MILFLVGFTCGLFWGACLSFLLAARKVEALEMGRVETLKKSAVIPRGEQ